jgi:hypothetical protein
MGTLPRHFRRHHRLHPARHFFQKSEPPPLVQPVAEPAKRDTLVLVVPPLGKSVGKNNVNITVKDKAKVGNINTGDSNKIDIKQDF